MELLWLIVAVTVTAIAAAASQSTMTLFSFLLSTAVAFFMHIANAAHTIILAPEKKNDSNSFSLNVNRQKSLMNSVHAYVLHSAEVFELTLLSGLLQFTTVILLYFKL